MAQAPSLAKLGRMKAIVGLSLLAALATTSAMAANDFDLGQEYWGCQTAN